jgi:hypothetical protein
MPVLIQITVFHMVDISSTRGNRLKATGGHVHAIPAGICFKHCFIDGNCGRSFGFKIQGYPIGSSPDHGIPSIIHTIIAPVKNLFGSQRPGFSIELLTPKRQFIYGYKKAIQNPYFAGLMHVLVPYTQMPGMPAGNFLQVAAYTAHPHDGVISDVKGTYLELFAPYRFIGC